MADTSDRRQAPDRDERIRQRMGRVAHIIIVISGKGGVGKSSVAVNLAWALSSRGKRVGILDIDVHGPNIPKMLGIEKKALHALGSDIEPVTVTPRLKAVSLALLDYEPDRPIVFRGPLKSALIGQFLGDVDWGELDYLVIDAPPGTGDEPLSAIQLMPKASNILVVTTPQDVAVADARKSVMFARALNMPVIGIVENMSGFVCPHCGRETDLFKKGGGEKAAAGLGVEFLGRIPFDPALVEYGDRGRPFTDAAPDSDTAGIFERIVDKIQGSMEKQNKGVEHADL